MTSLKGPGAVPTYDGEIGLLLSLSVDGNCSSISRQVLGSGSQLSMRDGTWR